MEALEILEKKLTSLVVLVTELREANEKLAEENTQLMQRLHELEGSVAQDTTYIEKLKQDKALTKCVVEDLIKNIDQIVTREQQL